MAKKLTEEEASKAYDEAKKERAKIKQAYIKATKVENEAWFALSKILKTGKRGWK